MSDTDKKANGIEAIGEKRITSGYTDVKCYKCGKENRGSIY